MYMNPCILYVVLIYHFHPPSNKAVQTLTKLVRSSCTLISMNSTASHHPHTVLSSVSATFSRPGYNWTPPFSDPAVRSILVSSVSSDTVAENAMVVHATTARVCSDVIARPLATRMMMSSWAMPWTWLIDRKHKLETLLCIPKETIKTMA